MQFIIFPFPNSFFSWVFLNRLPPSALIRTMALSALPRFLGSRQVTISLLPLSLSLLIRFLFRRAFDLLARHLSSHRTARSIAGLTSCNAFNHWVENDRSSLILLDLFLVVTHFFLSFFLYKFLVVSCSSWKIKFVC